MARGGDELDAEPAQVPADRAKHVDIRLAGVAAAGAHLPQAQRTAEQPAQFLVERLGQPHLLAPPGSQDEVLPVSRGEPMVAGLLDRAVRARLDAGRAENAASEVEERRPARRPGDGPGRADRDAFGAPFGALARLDPQGSAVPVRKGGRGAVRIGHRLAASLQAVGNGIEDEHGGQRGFTGRSRSRKG